MRPTPVAAGESLHFFLVSFRLRFSPASNLRDSLGAEERHALLVPVQLYLDELEVAQKISDLLFLVLLSLEFLQLESSFIVHLLEQMFILGYQGGSVDARYPQ